jgi:hypothetical protein
MRTALALTLSLATTSFLFAQDVKLGAPLPRKAVLGASLADLIPAEAASGPGVKILAVSPGLTAAGLNLQPGDILQTINGKKVAARGEVAPLVRTWVSGANVTLKVLRAGKPVVVTGPAVERPKMKDTDAYTVQYGQVESLGKRIRVITTVPKGTGPFPTVMLIGGIGAYSIDGEFAATAYGNVLESFAKTGYVVVRVDKPGQGDSEGPAYTDLGFDQEMDAYLQALRLTKQNPAVNKNAIAIFGHSMGGSFGPLVAEKEPVAALAVYGTLARSWSEYVLENTRRQDMLAGATGGQTDQSIKQLYRVVNYLFEEGLSPAEVIKRKPDLKEYVNAMVPDGKTYSGVGLPFFQALAKKNLAAAWEKCPAQVLSIYGENDFISGRTDHELIAELVNKVRPGSAEFKLLPASDHGFFQTTSPADSMAKWGRPGAALNPAIIETLRAFFERTIKKA